MSYALCPVPYVKVNASVPSDEDKALMVTLVKEAKELFPNHPSVRRSYVDILGYCTVLFCTVECICCMLCCVINMLSCCHAVDIVAGGRHHVPRRRK